MNTIKMPLGAKTSKKRIGRGIGSRFGGTSGKGNNGQNSRSGGGVRPGFEGGQMPLYRRVARRGFSNFPFKKQYKELNFKILCDNFEDGDIISTESLKEKKLLKNKYTLVKIILKGELSHKFTFNINKYVESRKVVEYIDNKKTRVEKEFSYCDLNFSSNVDNIIRSKCTVNLNIINKKDKKKVPRKVKKIAG